MSEFIRYWCVRSTTASGCASDSRRKREMSSPPFLAALFLTCMNDDGINEGLICKKPNLPGEVAESDRRRGRTSWKTAKDRGMLAT